MPSTPDTAKRRLLLHLPGALTVAFVLIGLDAIRLFGRPYLDTSAADYAAWAAVATALGAPFALPLAPFAALRTKANGAPGRPACL